MKDSCSNLLHPYPKHYYGHGIRCHFSANARRLVLFSRFIETVFKVCQKTGSRYDLISSVEHFLLCSHIWCSMSFVPMLIKSTSFKISSMIFTASAVSTMVPIQFCLQALPFFGELITDIFYYAFTSIICSMNPPWKGNEYFANFPARIMARIWVTSSVLCSRDLLIPLTLRLKDWSLIASAWGTLSPPISAVLMTTGFPSKSLAILE